MKRFRFTVLIVCLWGVAVAAQPADSLFQSDPCQDKSIHSAGDAEAAYSKATVLLNEGKSDLGERYMACAIHRGGNAYLFNAGVYFRPRDKPRALQYFLTASALGFDQAKHAAGEMLLETATTEQDRVIALGFLSSSLSGCYGAGLLTLRDEALRSKAPLALMEAYTWTKVRLSRSADIPAAAATYTAWLDELGTSMSAQMRRLAGERAVILTQQSPSCPERRKR